MKCVEIEKVLDEFVGDELDFAVRQKVDLHLRDCIVCRNEAEKLQDTARLLKSIPLIAPSKQFDARMMQAFQQHHETENQPNFWTAVFANFSISKSALAFGALILIAFTALAFQLGRLSASNNRMQETQASGRLSESKPRITQIVEKRVEVPVTKTIEVPVYKEKIVTRTVFKTLSQPAKSLNSTEARNSPAEADTVNLRQKRYEDFASISLEKFQPVSDIRISVVKKGNKDEN
jgi:hypothetical protein